MNAIQEKQHRLSRIYIAIILVPAVLLTQLHAQTPQAINPQMEAAILKEDWRRVVDILPARKASGPATRFIKAHALLALNRNNESLCLFLSVALGGNLRQWEEWTGNFVQTNPQYAVAHYFRGDALARLQQWDAALIAFNTALELHPKHALVLNSRGATYAAKRQWDAALIDFDVATQNAPAFADAHASLGALWIQRRTGADGAVDAFNRALQIAPDFALALNGRGCANAALGRWDEALQDLKSASKKAGCFNIPMVNLIALAQMQRELMAQAGEQLAQLKPGMSTEALTRYADSLSDPQATKSVKQAEWNRQWSAGSAAVAGFLAGAFGRESSESKGRLEVRASIPGIHDRGRLTGVTGELAGQQSRQRDLGSYFKNVEVQSKKDANYWGKTRDTIANRTGVGELTPGGATAEDLQHAYVDRGHWLDTGYSLIYYVEPLRISLQP